MASPMQWLPGSGGQRSEVCSLPARVRFPESNSRLSPDIPVNDLQHLMQSHTCGRHGLLICVLSQLVHVWCVFVYEQIQGCTKTRRLKKRKKRNHWEREPPLLVRLQLWHFTSGPHLTKMENSCPTSKAPDVAQFRYHNIIVQFTTRKTHVQLIQLSVRYQTERKHYTTPIQSA